MLCHNGPCRRRQLRWVAYFVFGMGKSHVCAPWSRVPACGRWVLSGIAPAGWPMCQFIAPLGREYQRVGRGLALSISGGCFCAPWSGVLVPVFCAPWFRVPVWQSASGLGHVSSHCAPWSRVPACGQGVDIGVSWDGVFAPLPNLLCAPWSRVPEYGFWLRYQWVAVRVVALCGV